MWHVALLLACGVRPGPVPYAELVEINHYWEASGEKFCQVIAWDWDPQYKRWHAQQWAMVEEWRQVGNKIVVRCKGEPTVEIRCKFVRESWTEVDPERENQRLFSAGERRKVW